MGNENKTTENKTVESVTAEMKAPEDVVGRMKELVSLLNQASRVYYAQDTEIMSNFEYDRLYDELVELEKETGVVIANSPTVHVGYEAVDELPKEKHEKPMLSLAKTKSREELRDWLDGREGLLSWKLDGLTIVLTYSGGQLVKAVTRGNGEVGEVITNNAKVFKNVPVSIPYQGELILRGEAVITYSEFGRINGHIEDVEAKYKNPRNLCSGSVRQLNNEITASRNVNFYAFSLVRADDEDFHNSRAVQFEFLTRQGFDVVEYRLVNPDTIEEEVAYFEQHVQSYDIPSDGLVLTYEDIAYGESLGRTAKFPRDSIAFKWADELCETVLKEMEWSASRTGLITPVAIFEPVELEGTTVSRASVHNISIVRGLKLGIGDRITVYKANMIIPQIAENLTQSDTLEIPEVCPVCGQPTQMRQVNDVQSLYCNNPACDAKKIKSFTLFVSRDAMNVDGLSESTLEKFLARGFIHEFADLFNLGRYEEEITQMEGFGEKSYGNLMESIENARNTTLPRVVYGLGIENVGVANARVLCRYFNFSLDGLRAATVEELSDIDGIGEVIATGIYDFFHDKDKAAQLERLLAEVHIAQETVEEGTQTLSGMSFVITGSLEHYENRNALKTEIEERGGKVTGSVTGKTTCLINNDTASQSSKNKKAKELGVRIISEETFMEEYL